MSMKKTFILFPLLFLIIVPLREKLTSKYIELRYASPISDKPMPTIVFYPSSSLDTNIVKLKYGRAFRIEDSCFNLVEGTLTTGSPYLKVNVDARNRFYQFKTVNDQNILILFSENAATTRSIFNQLVDQFQDKKDSIIKDYLLTVIHRFN